MNRIRILIADDHLAVRGQIFSRLIREPDLEIVAVADDSAQAFECALSSEPDIVLIDPTMRDGLGLEILRRLHARLPQLAFIALSAFTDTAQAMALREAGVCKILDKGIASQELVEILKAIGHQVQAPPSLQQELASHD